MDTIRWYLVPRVTGLDGRRRTNPIMSQVDGSRCYAVKVDHDWSLVQIVTDQFGHEALGKVADMLPLPSVRAQWRDAPVEVVSKFLGVASGSDAVGVALDKVWLSLTGQTREAIRRKLPITLYGKTVDDAKAVED